MFRRIIWILLNKICRNICIKMCEVLILISIYVNCFVTFDKRNAHSKSNKALMHFFWDRNRNAKFQTERNRMSEWSNLWFPARDKLIKIVLLQKCIGVGSKYVCKNVCVILDSWSELLQWHVRMTSTNVSPKWLPLIKRCFGYQSIYHSLTYKKKIIISIELGLPAKDREMRHDHQNGSFW